MKFMRPYLQLRPKNSEWAKKSRQQNSPSPTQVSIAFTIFTELLQFMNFDSFQSSGDELIVVDAPEIELDFHLLDGELTNDGCFEILNIDDDDNDDDGIYNEFPVDDIANDDGIYYEFPVDDIANDSLIELLDDDDDKAFGALIADELRKMSPAAQKAFKRDVSELMYE